ncbi:uncharacterized protein ACA1_101350 [Acanthamoeba castellanii str. Neff]|uniref:Uncharacterized protein n=1 Tax=Acanthamoeba castellanii (strain ATCC 30010 / Neff) TaxID=1257118 RepID=L8GGX3_ACACF|nr:uncharacterized protein ACA1_101350 [Acanthamoeba castellanii str. Neff]ELR12074.1 hypothetical protein ACA1_101350 [Acanthamoeba castellanii str. Neff]
MKLQMAEMKELLEGKVHELQAKLAEEKKKSDSDVAQWKAMAQKELKTRLQLESEKAALQKELQEVKRQSQILSAGRVEQMQLDESSPPASSPSSQRSSGKWRSDPRPSHSSRHSQAAFREPLLVDDGEPEGDGDVSIWTPSKAGAGQVSSTCFNCTLQ